MTKAAVAASAVAAASLLGSGVSLANERPAAVDVQLYRPALDGEGVFSIERATTLKKYGFTLRLSTDFALAPLELDTMPVYGVDDMDNPTITEDGSIERVLDSTTSINLGFAFGITDRLTLGVELPVLIQPLGDGYGARGAPTAVDATPRPGTGLFSSRPTNNTDPSERPTGDLRVGLKLRLAGGLAFQLVGWMPFGDEDVFAGSRGVTVEPRVIYDILTGAFKVTLNVAARLREGSLVTTRQVAADGTLINAMGQPAGLDPSAYISTPRLFIGSELYAGVGIAYELTDRLGIGVDGHAFVPLTKADEGTCTGECKDGDFTAEVIAGASYDLTGGLAVAAGAGAGVITDAARSPTFRVLLGLTWAPGTSGARKLDARGDRDGDKIPDVTDLCPDEPEDDDGFQNDDGCPELDNDLDGVLDAQDQCKDDPEDRDGVEDEDGCPDGDNDGDGVPDLNDRCPSDKEDADGFDDGDGCPEDDNDGDGFADAKDQCPNEAESINNYQDDDGCPDVSAAGGPKLGPTELDLQGDRIEFEGNTDRLSKKALVTLDLVAAVMRDKPGIRFRIEVGVEETKKDARSKAADQALTARRAFAVQQYLLAKGIGIERVQQAVGLGSARPIDRDVKSQRNRRVQFIRLDQ